MNQDAPAGFYDRPTLVVDPSFHTAPIFCADAAAGFAVTASHDKTVRVFNLADGRLVRTIRLPAGPGHVGKAFTVALSSDGELVAAGGFTDRPGNPQQIYLFDRASGALVKRLHGLPQCVHGLAFSPDRRFLAAVLGCGFGMRVFDRAQDWGEVTRDPDYSESSYNLAFASDGRLATTSADGRIRLYNSRFQRIRTLHAPKGEPFGISFNPAGDRLAVGYCDTMAVSLLDARTLATLDPPDTADLEGGDLLSVAWSGDGATLFAAGRHGTPGKSIIAWNDGGVGVRRSLLASTDTIMSLVPLLETDLLVAAHDPYLACIATNGTPRWPPHGPSKADLRRKHSILAVSADGNVVDFGYDQEGGVPVRFDLAKPGLTLDPVADGRTAAPEQESLPVANWAKGYRPTLAGEPLPLEPYEISCSIAIHPEGDRLVLGTEWYLRSFDAAGMQLWQRPVPGSACAVNVIGDGRLFVAACGDGTIRWHRMHDGHELLAFFPLADRKNWVCWTPEGYYAATPEAHGVLRWHVNRGLDRAADAIPVENVEAMRRPDVLPLVLQELDIVRALGIAELNRARRAVVRATDAAVSPGARLHVLAMGVSDYGEAARQMRLKWAHQDAHDVASALASTQAGTHGLYAQVRPQLLQDEAVTRERVFEALEVVERGMAEGGNHDLAIAFFSGHGAQVSDDLYLLPYGITSTSNAAIRTHGLSVEELSKCFAGIAQHGAVLVLLDACHSGGFDAGLLRERLKQPQVAVLTSSRGSEFSIERDDWQNGAFTEAFLDALKNADTDGNGLISIADLQIYLDTHVRRLTEGAQIPGIEVRFQREIFAAAL